MKKTKQFLAMVLALLMICSVLPTSAWAAEPEEPVTAAESEVPAEPEEPMMEETEEEPSEEPAETPTEEPAETPAEEPAETPAEEPAETPAGEPAAAAELPEEPTQPEEEEKALLPEEENDTDGENGFDTVYFINPMYEDLFSVEDFQGADDGVAAASNVDTRNASWGGLSDTAAAVRSNMKNRQTSFTVYYSTTKYYYDLNEICKDVVHKALDHTGKGTEGDYLLWHLGGYRCKGNRELVGSTYHYTVRFNVEYSTTASQEKQVTDEVNRLVKSLKLKDSSLRTDEKIWNIYHYLTENVTYDNSVRYGYDDPISHTAYGALIRKNCVCQGYSNAFYRLALEAGIDCRQIPSTLSGKHIYNIVKLNGKYYNLDATWDAPDDGSGVVWYTGINYFLKTDATFAQDGASHQRQDSYDVKYGGYVNVFTDYTSSGFYSKYPMATSDYDIGWIFLPRLTGVYNGNGYVKFSWRKTLDADRYNVYRRTEGGYWEYINTTTDTFYRNSGVTSGRLYEYTVSAIFDEVKSSNMYDPGIKTRYLATPAVQSATTKNGYVQVTWKAVPGATKYAVYRKEGSSGWKKLGESTGTSYKNTGVVSGKKYTYTVRAQTTNFISEYSRVGKTATYVGTPKITECFNGNGYVKISWTKVPGIDHYNLYRKNDKDGTWQFINRTTNTYYRNSGVTSGRTYRYRVTAAASNDARSANSNEVTIKYLGVPKMNSVSMSGSAVKLNWKAVPGAAKYIVYYKTGSSGWKKLNETTRTTYYHRSAQKGKTYCYTVRAATTNFHGAYNTGGWKYTVR